MRYYSGVTMCVFFSASTHTFLDQCSFEFENICGMIQGTNHDQDWVHQQGSVLGQEDHTLSGRCRGKTKEWDTFWAEFSPGLITMTGSEKLLDSVRYLHSHSH